MAQPGKPDWSALRTMFEDTKRAWSNIDQTRQRLAQITGTAWSPDRMVKVVVGPRGQLIDLEIDPRVFRKPDAKALAATILAATRVAVEDATGRVREAVEESIPKDLRGRGLMGGPELDKLVYGRDGDDVRSEENNV